MKKNSITITLLILISGSLCLNGQANQNKLSKPILDSLILAFWNEVVVEPGKTGQEYVDVMINRGHENRTNVTLCLPLSFYLYLNPRSPVISYFVLENTPVIIRTNVFDGLLAQFDPYQYRSSYNLSYYPEAFISFIKEHLPATYRNTYDPRSDFYTLDAKGDTLYQAISIIGKTWYWDITFRGNYILEIKKELR